MVNETDGKLEKNLFNLMRTALAEVPSIHPVGRVTAVGGGTVEMACQSADVRVGDRGVIRLGAQTLAGEVVRLAGDCQYLLMDGTTQGISIGDRVVLRKAPLLAPDDSWIGRVIDPDGRALDGPTLLPGSQFRDIDARPPPAQSRRPLGKRLETGLAVLNTLLPLVQGQRIGLFAGSGVGKSTLLADLARGVEADVIVIGLVGERGREVQDFVQNVLGPDGMKRAVLVAATSDQAPQVRKRCALTAMAVAEYFRDQGKQVLLLLDSITRFCEAHRELAVAAGEAANLRGYPASTNAAIARLCERAGPGAGASGDITAVFSVLVAGSDMEEPIADMLRGVLDGHVILDREIAERGRFPAIDVVRSVSRSLPQAATPQENTIISQARALMGSYARSELLIQSGLYVSGSDPKIDNAIRSAAALDEFLATKDQRGTLAHFAKLRQALVATPMQKDDI